MHTIRGTQQVCGLPGNVQLLASSSAPKVASNTVSSSNRGVATVSAQSSASTLATADSDSQWLPSSWQNMLEMLEQQYPARLVPELAQQTQGCLQDCLDAFPNAATIPAGHLHGLVSAVESLLRISDYQRRRILHHMKKHNRRPERCGDCSHKSMGCD